MSDRREATLSRRAEALAEQSAQAHRELIAFIETLSPDQLFVFAFPPALRISPLTHVQKCDIMGNLSYLQ
jgi:hypothetical protein